jgi:hypothetical protein
MRPWTASRKKIFEIKEKDGNLLGLGLTKYSGNFGITNYGVEGMMSSLGYTTASLAPPAGRRASTPRTTTWATCGAKRPRGHGQSQIRDRLGRQPRLVSVHSMKYIMEAKGAEPRSWS